MQQRLPESERPQASEDSGRIPTVLIVDDEPEVREFVDRVLRQAGYVTTTAEDGQSALALAAKHDPFDLLVTDVRMPGMSGDELARRMRMRDPALKVLYLTGYSDQLFHAHQTLWEDEAFLEKPQGVAALLEAVSLLLYGRIESKSTS